jgi:hypothetical protein
MLELIRSLEFLQLNSGRHLILVNQVRMGDWLWVRKLKQAQVPHAILSDRKG